MARKDEELGGGRIRRVASKIAHVFHRKHDDETEVPVAQEAQPQKRSRPQQSAAKRVTRPSDIGTDVLNRTYTPPDTSAKTSFRSDGADHQTDQEFAAGTSDERWNDEDRFTNKSGDPRIGTHGRTYEPGEINDRHRRP